jgi:hypothetical protein
MWLSGGELQVSRGRYLPQDAVKAYIWSSIAAHGGDRVAQTNRDVAARKFSPQELSQVKATGAGVFPAVS